MQTFIQLLFILLLTSCETTKKENEIDILKSDTILLNGIQVIEHKKDGRLWNINALSGDIIVESAPYYFEASYLDINADGFIDIRTSIISNTPNQSENYLYDNPHKRFRKIGDSDLEIKKLKGIPLYFSYNSVGCSDHNWESHLSKIDNWKEVRIGHISTKSCGDKEDGIYIYKLNGDREILLAAMPIDTLNMKSDKWNFIKQYWESNHTKFN
jgi:hypothetical protein